MNDTVDSTYSRKPAYKHHFPFLQLITNKNEGEDNLHGHGALVGAGGGVAFCLAKSSVPSIENMR